jgi:hypothetical protein
MTSEDKNTAGEGKDGGHSDYNVPVTEKVAAYLYGKVDTVQSASDTKQTRTGKEPRILSVKEVKNRSFINVAIVLCILVFAAIWLYTTFLWKLIFAGASFVNGLIIMAPIWIPLIAFALLGSFFAVIGILAVLIELVHDKKLNIKRSALTGVLIGCLFFPGVMPITLAVSYVVSYTGLATQQVEYTLNNGPSAADKEKVNLNSYAEVKQKIDDCMVRSIMHLPYDYLGSIDEPKNLYLEIYWNDENDRYAPTGKLYLPFSDREKLVADIKASRNTCTQSVGIRMYPTQYDKYGNIRSENIP